MSGSSEIGLIGFIEQHLYSVDHLVIPFILVHPDKQDHIVEENHVLNLIF